MGNHLLLGLIPSLTKATFEWSFNGLWSTWSLWAFDDTVLSTATLHMIVPFIPTVQFQITVGALWWVLSYMSLVSQICVEWFAANGTQTIDSIWIGDKNWGLWLASILGQALFESYFWWFWHCFRFFDWMTNFKPLFIWYTLVLSTATKIISPWLIDRLDKVLNPA